MIHNMTTAAIIPRDEASLNVVIPMGGSDEQFKRRGYSAPKPMIKIAGRPMLLHLLDSLKLRLGDVVWLILPSAMYLQFQSQLDLNQEYPRADIRICTFTCQTRGAIETIYIGLQHMTPAELNRRLLCLDCDTLYFSDVLSMFRATPRQTGMCAYRIDRGTAAPYSYLRLNEEDGLVAEVCEKSAISDLANVGGYGFASGTVLRSFIGDVLDHPTGGLNEYFLSNIINCMLAHGHPFAAKETERIAECGSPEALEQYMDLVSAGRALSLPKRRFCFALDNVLVTPPVLPGDMSTVAPIEKNIQLVRELKAAGHYIIIASSRGMQEYGGNVGAVVAACGPQTLRTLQSLEIPYDEIHFGQPFAHVYVDASVACSALNTEKDLGWRLKNQQDTLEPGMVAARHFNNVQLEGDYVVKTASESVLRGEIFFYEHMPADIAHFFPTLIASFNAQTQRRTRTTPRRKASDVAATTSLDATAKDNASHGVPKLSPRHVCLSLEEESMDGADLAATDSMSGDAIAGVSSLTLSRVKGITFSHLVTNRALTPGRLVFFLQVLRTVHSSVGDRASLRSTAEVNVCSNYLPKLQKRYHAHQALYGRLSAEADSMYSWIQQELTSYEAKGRTHPANVIHGDPVFSNVLYTDDGSIYLLDMRGELGSTLTLQGDTVYDLSKVYQSLLGYDFILLSQPLLERDAELLEELRDTFRTFVKDHYPSVAFSDIVKITASHFFGIVPLHVNKDHQIAYLQTAQALISTCPDQ